MRYAKRACYCCCEQVANEYFGVTWSQRKLFAAGYALIAAYRHFLLIFYFLFIYFIQIIADQATLQRDRKFHECCAAQACIVNLSIGRSVYMKCSDVTVMTRRHVVGILCVNKNKLKMRKSENCDAKFFSQTAFIDWCVIPRTEVFKHMQI